MRNASIRIALITDDPPALPAWIVRLLDSIAETAGLECHTLITPLHVGNGPRVPWPVGAWLALEAKLFARPARTAASAHETQIIRSDDTEALEALAPDVILDLTGGYGSGIDPRLARYGIWFADCIGEQPGLAGLRSLLRGADINPLSLFRRTADGLHTITTGAVNPKFAATRNELFLKEKSVALILRELRRLAHTGTVSSEAGVDFEPFASPEIGRFAFYVGSVAREGARRIGEGLLARLGFRPGMFEINSLYGSLPDFDPGVARSTQPGPYAYHADPFLWRHEGENYCFFETYDYRRGKGHISVGRWVDGRLTSIRTALATDYHLSFPFLFEHEGELFMMPESCARKRIEVWRCTRFPDRWELHATAMEGVTAADSSLAEIDGRWWLFTNISTDSFGDMNSELHLFQVDVPDFRRIIPHPLNPVTFDARYARNGGRIIEQGGVLFRPAQENSHGTYGYGISLLQIETLSMEAYSEALVRRIQPDFLPGLIGCHHLDVCGDLIVFDARRRMGGRARRTPADAAAA